MKGSCPEGKWRGNSNSDFCGKLTDGEVKLVHQAYQACRSWDQSWGIWSLKSISVFHLIYRENHISFRSTSSLACLWQDKLFSEAWKIQQ